MPDKSLNCNFINCLLTDNENIWVGTEIGGINLLTPNCLQTYVWQYNYLQKPLFPPIQSMPSAKTKTEIYG